MKLRLFPLVSLCAWGALAALNGSCANKDAGAFISMSVSPEKPYIVPGKGVSCIAAAAGKAADTVPTADLSENRILYSNFKLQWRSPDKLTIVSLRAIVTGSGIDGAEGQTITFSETEIQALLGLENLTIDSDATNPQRVATIDSSDPAYKSTGSNYEVCGLHLSGITIKKGVKSFVASVKFEIVGFSTSLADGSQSPVRQTARAKAELF